MSRELKPLNSLTGLRIVAALAVFIHHVSGDFGLPKLRAPLGAWGVSFFFVLSGFILTYVYNERLSKKTIKTFYFTRWARIWPLHIFCLGLIFVVAGPANLCQGDFIYKFLASILLLQSWIPDTDYNFAFNGVAWSISTELFFYAVFPLFLIGGRKSFWMKYLSLFFVMMLLVSSIAALSRSYQFPGINFMALAQCNPLIRLPEFCTGMAAGFVFLNRNRQQNPRQGTSRLWIDSILELATVVGLFAYVLLVINLGFLRAIKQAVWGGEFLSEFFRFSSGCIVFTAMIYVFAGSRGILAQVLGSRPIVFLGEVSFAFYMVHAIVIRCAQSYSLFFSGISPFLVAILLAVISLALSVLLYKLIEVPSKTGLIKLMERKPRNQVFLGLFHQIKFLKPLWGLHHWLRCWRPYLYWQCTSLKRNLPGSRRPSFKTRLKNIEAFTLDPRLCFKDIRSHQLEKGWKLS